MLHLSKASKGAVIFHGRVARRSEPALRVLVALGVVTAATSGCSDALEGANGTGGAATGGGAGSGLAANAGSSAAMSGAGSGTIGTAGAGTGGTAAGASSGGASAGTGAAPTAGSGGASATGGAGAMAGASATGGMAGIGGSGGGGRGGAGAGGGPAGGSGGSPPGDRTTSQGVCARWNGDRANLSEGTWSGSVATCTAGDISADGRANALRLFNLYRWLADLPAVQTEASRDAQAQACALMQHANWRTSGLSHEPPMSWTCWTQLGADGSSSSNISGGPGVSSVDAYMIDNGNETTFGHRRIVLSNQLGPIGLGSAGPGGASCMQNLRGTGNAGKTWMAWPSPGIIPLQAIRPRGRTLDQTGWSVQSNTIDVTRATVTVTAGGANQPVTVSALTGSYGGARYAIRIVPTGWQTAAGQTYTVTLAGTSTPIAYAVEVVDCGS